MDYPRVKRSHVVPRSYLRGFAIDGTIAMRLVGETTSREIPLGDAGVLNNAYVRTRPDGTPIYDVEWSLGHIEKVAAPILRDLVVRWPVRLQEKAILAEFIGVQLVRGARWRDWHSSFTQDFLSDVTPSEFKSTGSEGLTHQEKMAGATRVLTSDTVALVKMLEQSRIATQVIASMHWTLVEFAQPWLATSDHPVVIWPIHARSRLPIKSGDFLAGGLVNTLELRFPVSRRHGLLMTWLDASDGEAAITQAPREVAANFNAFSTAEAENQWFHVPGTAPSRASGQLLPLAPRLFHGYTPNVALESTRRGETRRHAQEKIGAGSIRAAELTIVTIDSDGQARIGQASRQSAPADSLPKP